MRLVDRFISNSVAMRTPGICVRIVQLITLIGSGLVGLSIVLQPERARGLGYIQEFIPHHALASTLMAAAASGVILLTANYRRYVRVVAYAHGICALVLSAFTVSETVSLFGPIRQTPVAPILCFLLATWHVLFIATKRDRRCGR